MRSVSMCCSLILCIFAYAIDRGGPSIIHAELDYSPSPGDVALREQVSSSFQTVELDPYPGKPRISFKEDGSFKLTIFSDVHFGENPWDAWGPEQDVNTTTLMELLLNVETPDYV